MNERIKELAKGHFCRWEYENGDVHECYEFSEDELKSFAELIIKECAAIVQNKIEVSRYVHEAELLRECSTTIKQHFGVEE